METKLTRYRELKIELRSIMTLNPRLREFIKCVLDINELLVEGLQSISENQINAVQTRSLVDQARAVLVDHESRISALEAS